MCEGNTGQVKAGQEEWKRGKLRGSTARAVNRECNNHIEASRNASRTLEVGTC